MHVTFCQCGHQRTAHTTHCVFCPCTAFTYKPPCPHNPPNNLTWQEQSAVRLAMKLQPYIQELQELENKESMYATYHTEG